MTFELIILLWFYYLLSVLFWGINLFRFRNEYFGKRLFLGGVFAASEDPRYGFAPD